jgi:hypothetical protein
VIFFFISTTYIIQFPFICFLMVFCCYWSFRAIICFAHLDDPPLIWTCEGSLYFFPWAFQETVQVIERREFFPQVTCVLYSESVLN